MGRLTVLSSCKLLIVKFPEPMAESICSTSSCPGLRKWPRNRLRMKEKNLRCKFGKIETSNVGNVNQDGTQEDIIRRCQRDLRSQRLVLSLLTLQYMVAVTYKITSGSYVVRVIHCHCNFTDRMIFRLGTGTGGRYSQKKPLSKET